VVGDEQWKLDEGKEIAIPGITATLKYATIIDKHMQDQYFWTDRADITDVVFKDTPYTRSQEWNEQSCL